MRTAQDAPARSEPAVAFFRNLNQGQRNSPSRLALMDAMTRGGATDVATFQVNGTVVFTASDPEACIREAVNILSGESVWHDVAFVRSVSWVERLVTSIQSDASQDHQKLELSLFAESMTIGDRLPLAGRRCAVVSGGFGYAVTVNERLDESNATPTIERAIGRPVTSRGLPTLTRLIARFGA